MTTNQQLSKSWHYFIMTTKYEILYTIRSLIITKYISNIFLLLQHRTTHHDGTKQTTQQKMNKTSEQSQTLCTHTHIHIYT